MSNQLVITSGAKVRSLEGVITGSTGVLNSLPINGANGIPQLDSNGKILVSQLPNSVMEYKGTWDAATNTPTLANGTGNQGDVYLCNVAGTVNFGAGPITFYVGDQVIYSGSIWQRASGASGTVTSVAITESGDALTITGSPITTSGTINIGFAGTSAQYVAGDGSLITFPALTGYVPYTGATSDVDLGTFSLNAKSLHIKGVGGNGHLGLKHQSANPTGSANESLLFADVNGNFGWQNDNLYLTTLSTHANTANRTYTFPNASGTVALNNIDNVFTAEQTFSAPIDLNNALNLGFNIAGVGIGSSQLGLYATKASTTSNLTMYDGDTGFYARFAFNNTSNKIYTLPSTSGTLALTSDIPSLSATAPISYSSGVISISQATTSTNGYLSSTDWNTFNNKQNALTNPVIGTGALYQVSYFNGVSSISGSNNLKFDGINLSIGNPSSALAQLHIYNASAAASILLQTNSTTDYSEIAVRNDSSTATSYFRQYSTAATGSDFGISRAGLALFFSNYATNFAIGTRNGGSLIFGTADTERARIDTSGNFGIGIASPSYKLDVNGTGRFTGALNGTSATFSGNVNVGTNIAQLLPITTTNFQILTGCYYDGSNIIATATSGTRIISNAGSFTFNNFTGATIGGSVTDTARLTIASTGAATFSSSVTQPYSIFTGATPSYPTSGQGIIDGNAGNLRLFSYTDILFYTNGSQKATITSGGNVGIGTSSPNLTTTNRTVLDINGTSTSLIALSSGGTYKSYIFNDGTDITYYSTGSTYINSATSTIFKTSGTITSLTLASTGAATFSSSVTAGGELNIGSGALSSDRMMQISGTSFTSGTGQFGLVINPTFGNTITNVYGIYLANNIGTGVTNRYQLYIDAASGTPTNDYAIYSANSNKSYFAGNVGIGTSSGSNKFAVSAGGVTSDLYINSSGGVGSYTFGTGPVYASGGILTMTNPSDIRLKENIEDIQYGLADILKLRPVKYHWKNDKINQGLQFGFIAQEVQEIMPEAIKEFGEDVKYLGLEKDAIYATLVKAIQELKAEINELKNK